MQRMTNHSSKNVTPPSPIPPTVPETSALPGIMNPLSTANLNNHGQKRIVLPQKADNDITVISQCHPCPQCDHEAIHHQEPGCANKCKTWMPYQSRWWCGVWWCSWWLWGVKGWLRQWLWWDGGDIAFAVEVVIDDKVVVEVKRCCFFGTIAMAFTVAFPQSCYRWGYNDNIMRRSN